MTVLNVFHLMDAKMVIVLMRLNVDARKDGRAHIVINVTNIVYSNTLEY